jgi:PKD domain
VKRQNSLRAASSLLVALALAAVPAALAPLTGASSLGSGTARSAGAGLPSDLPHLAPPTLTWKNITATAGRGPSPRASGGMIYDSTDGYLVLFGGETPGAPELLHNDTWKFADGVWTNISSSPAPSPRFGFQLADDPADGAVVLFGGQGHGPGETYLNDTWEFRAGTWTNETRNVAPPGRFWGSMSYDSQTSTVILFGGKEGPAPAEEYSNDTWSFHAGVWIELHPTALPPGRNGQAQANAPGDGGVVVFGGLNLTEDLNDTWAYASGTWTATGVATAPDTRTGAGLAFDAAVGAVVMYGGYPSNSYPYATWLLEGGSWTRYSVTPSPPDGTVWGQLAYDTPSSEVLYFESDAHYNSTWALNVTPGTGGPLELSGSVTPTGGTEPLNITCTATATGGTMPYDFAWTFGDGTGSALENTTHTFDRVGTFTVSVNVTDHLGSKAQKNWTVTVRAAGGGGSSPNGLGSVELYAGIAAALLVVLLAVLFFGRRRRKPKPSPPATGAPPGPSPPA